MQWGPESGHIEDQNEAGPSEDPDTGPSEEPTQGPVRSRVFHKVWGKALCILTLVLTRGWLWILLSTDSGPHYMPTVIHTKAWLSSSLVPDSHPHFGWKFSSSGLVSANTMLKNLCSFVEWMAINRVFFRHISFSNCLDSKMWECHVSTEDLISRVTARIFPCIFQASWTYS